MSFRIINTSYKYNEDEDVHIDEHKDEHKVEHKVDDVDDVDVDKKSIKKIKKTEKTVPSFQIKHSSSSSFQVKQDPTNQCDYF